MKTRQEFVVGAAQRCLRIKFQVPAEIDQRKQHVAKLVFARSLVLGGNCLAQFGDLLLDLVEDRRRVAPVEPDTRGFLLQFQRACQRGKGEGDLSR